MSFKMKFSDCCSHAANIEISEHSFYYQVSGTSYEKGDVRINVIFMCVRTTIFVVGEQLVVHVLSVCV